MVQTTLIIHGNQFFVTLLFYHNFREAFMCMRINHSFINQISVIVFTIKTCRLFIYTGKRSNLNQQSFPL